MTEPTSHRVRVVEGEDILANTLKSMHRHGRRGWIECAVASATLALLSALNAIAAIDDPMSLSFALATIVMVAWAWLAVRAVNGARAWRVTDGPKRGDA